MKVSPTTLPGVLLVELEVYRDPRGWLLEAFQRDRYAAHGIVLDAIQSNLSWSARGVVRGLHYQLVHPQAKLVHVPHGAVFDVAVDVRAGSPTFGRWHGAELSAENHRQHWIPPGFAHGFAVLSAGGAAVAYALSAYRAEGDDHAVRWNDPEIAIAWPLDGAPTLSPRDAAAPLLREARLPSLSGAP